MCWSKLLAQCRCSRCGVLCCKKQKTFAKLTKFQTVETPVPILPEPAPMPVTELLQIRANRDRLMTAGSIQRESSVSTPTPSTTPEVNNLARLSIEAANIEEMVEPYNVVVSLTNATEIMTKVLNRNPANAENQLKVFAIAHLNSNEHLSYVI